MRRMSERATTAGGTAMDRVAILGAAVLFSTGGAAIKATALSGWQVAGFRSAIAAAALVALLPAARRGWNLRVVAVGIAYAATMILFVLGNKLTTAANTIFLQDTAPLYVLLLGPWLLAEPIRRRDLGLMAAIAAGMALFFVGLPPATAIAPNPFAGNLCAAAAGLTWALTILGLRWLGRGTSAAGASTAAVACGNLIAAAAALPLAFPVAAARPVDWGLVVFLGLFQIGLAYVLLTRGVRRVPALETALLLLAEPVLNPIWTWLVHGETITAAGAVGALLILAATAANAMLPSHERA